MVKVLVEFASWAVCETNEDERNKTMKPEVYAEHFRDCKVDEGNDPDQPSWSWEFDDEPNFKTGCEECWKCGGVVPEKVVALVALYNWDRKRRNY